MGRSFKVDLIELYEMLSYIRIEAENAGFDPFRVSQIELAAEEALVNIVSYGYPEEEEAEERGVIKIDCKKLPKRSPGIKITIKDNGIPYNPITSPRRPIPYPFRGMLLKPGGYGIFFILKIMDEVEYTREKNINILKLIKYL